MADSVSSDAAPAVEQRSGVEQPAKPQERDSHGRRLRFELRHRFGIAYLVLAAAVGAAVGLFIVFLGQPSASTRTPAGQAWSTFHPQVSGELGAKEIARQVSSEYRLPSGEELDRVIAQRPQYQNIRMNFNLIRPSDAQSSKDLALLEVGNGIMYILCGSGDNCGMGGTPSPKRLLLVRREAIELALLTFKNDPAVQTVLSLLPPAVTAGQPVTTAVVFRRVDLQSELAQPLAASLPGRPPFTVTGLSGEQQNSIHRISDSAFFEYRAGQAADGTPYLILNPAA